MYQHASMNRVFRVVWNASLGVWQAVGEIGKGAGKGTSHTRKNRTKKAALALTLFISGSQLYAGVLPQGAQVTAGSASIYTNGNTLNVVQSSDKTAINWQSFNIGKDATVNFQQPNAGSVALNRVVGNETSLIEGALKANGQIFLLNSNGVLFSKDAQVNTGGIVASTLDLSDADFMAGKTQFSANGSKASIINLGTITAKDGGYVALLGNQVKNEGIITATLGTAVMAAGDKVSLNFNGNSLVGVTVDQGTLNALVENKNAIITNDGLVVLTAKGIDQVMAGVVNKSGEIKANSIVEKGGKIYLMGDEITNSGTLSADGKTGGGEVLVGGDWQGSNADKFPHATKVTLTETSDISASATEKGDGGKIVAWSAVHDDKSVTKVAGKLSAQSKGDNSQGGKIETSGHALVVDEKTQVKAKEWLLDPVDITIESTGSTSDLTGSSIKASFIESTLSGGTDVTLTATNNININEALAWSQNTLTLTATNNIYINDVVSVSGTGALTMTASTSWDKGILMGWNSNMTFKGKVNYTSSGALTINNDIYTVITTLGAQGSTTGTDLQGMKGNLAGKYALGGDITIGATDDTWNSSKGFDPVGSDLGKFTGKFYGLGHEISGLTVTQGSTYSYGAGLFGVSTGRISGIAVTSVNVLARGNSGTGGLSGKSEGYVLNSYTSGSVTSNDPDWSAGTGGLVGVNYGGSIFGSYSSAMVSTRSTHTITTGIQATLGGLVGSAVYGNIKQSFATGNVGGTGKAGTAKMMGGLIGEVRNASMIITDVYATGSVTSDVGGATTMSASATQGESPTGSVAYTPYVGGLIGLMYNGSISNAYATGLVTNNSATPNVGAFIGTITGNGSATNGTISNSFWNSTINTTVTAGQGSGTTTGVTNLTGKTTTDMQSFATYSSWSSSIAGDASLSNVYPQLRWATTGLSAGSSVWVISPPPTTPIYLRLIAGSSTYGDTPTFTYGLYDASSAGNTISDATPTGTITWTGAPTATSNAGTYSMTYSSGITLGNSAYTLSAGSAVNWTVNARTVTLTATKPYDGTTGLTGSQITIGNLVGSETLTYTGATANDAHVATASYINAITLANGTNGGLATNYALPTLDNTNAPVTITAATLTPTLTNTGVTKEYDGATSAPTGFIPTYSFQGLAANDTDATLTHTSAIYNDANVVNANQITVSGLQIGSITGTNSSAASDYVLDANSKTVGAVISAKPITITADAKSKAEGANDPTLTYQVTTGSLVGSDTLSGVLSRATGESAGNYAITQGTLANSNYAITYATANLTITSTVTPAPAPAPTKTLADYNDFTDLTSSYIESLLNTATTGMVNNLSPIEAGQIVKNLNVFNAISHNHLSKIVQKLSVNTVSSLGSSKVASIINALSDNDLKALPLTVKNSLIFSLSVQDFLSSSLPNLYTNEERLINMANMPLDNINAQSQVLLMSALNALSGKEISTLGANKIAELINKINLDFTAVPDAKVVDIIKNIPANTFSQLDSSKVASIINTLPDAELKALPLSVKNNLLFSLSEQDYLTVTLPNLYTNQERLINMANMPLDNINAQSQVLLMNALNALSGKEIATLGATKIAELINKVNLDFTIVPDAKVVDIVSNIPSSTFSQLDSSKVASIINTLPDAELKALPLSVKNNLLFSLSEQDYLTVTLPNLYTNQERLINMANMPLDNINAQSQVLLMNALNALSGAEIATLGATKIAELINKVNLDFTIVPDAKVIDIVGSLPINTFENIEQLLLKSIINSITEQEFLSLPSQTQLTIRSIIEPQQVASETLAIDGAIHTAAQIATQTPITIFTPQTTQSVSTTKAFIPSSNNTAVQIGSVFSAETPISVISSPTAGEPMQTVTLSQARDMLSGGSDAHHSNSSENGKKSDDNSENGNNRKNTTNTQRSGAMVQDVSVPVSRNSMASIVNGGVRLPAGLEQQLFVVKGN